MELSCRKNYDLNTGQDTIRGRRGRRRKEERKKETGEALRVSDHVLPTIQLTRDTLGLLESWVSAQWWKLLVEKPRETTNRYTTLCFTTPSPSNMYVLSRTKLTQNTLLLFEDYIYISLHEAYIYIRNCNDSLFPTYCGYFVSGGDACERTSSSFRCALSILEAATRCTRVCTRLTCPLPLSFSPSPFPSTLRDLAVESRNTWPG